MYFYIFDPKGDRELKYFERIQGQLLNLLAESRIEGEAYRVTAIRTIELLVEQALSADAKTIIVVGGDGSLNKTINALVRKQAPLEGARAGQADVTVGFVPLHPESSLAHILGITSDIEQAVKTLAGRLTQWLDLGKVGEHYFLSRVDLGQNSFSRMDPGFWGLGAARAFLAVGSFVVKLSLEDSYTATSEVLGAQIINSRSNQGCHLRLGDPTDQLLDVLLLHKLTTRQIFYYRRELATGCLDNVPGATVMHAKKIEILGPKKLPLSIEGQIYTKAPATITVAKEKIKMIVGKHRQF